ncbi:MAG: hypothetical protein JWP13_104 [Candidatus Saccharibacteria bacterium]|nr:hypothetical protein [Candidatus Saccharibacteria bacterium]
MSIKRWFVPHRANNYHPHLLRPLGLVIVVATLLVINIMQNVMAANAWHVLGVATNVNDSDIIALSNQERINNGLPVLGYNPQLAAAAEAKARDMFAKDYWAHNAPDGTPPWAFITAAGYAYVTAGENLAKDFDTSTAVVAGWMNSAGHRANILNSAFKETGVAAINGTLQGSATTLVVAMYAAPKTVVTAPPPAPAAPTATKPIPAQTEPAATAAPSTPAEPVPTPPADQPAPAPATAVTRVNSSVQLNTTAAPEEIDTEAIAFREQRNWAQNATLFVLTTLFLVTILKHTVVWRTHKKGMRHVWLRAHPAAQYALLLVAIAANLMSGLGVVK